MVTKICFRQIKYTCIYLTSMNFQYTQRIKIYSQDIFCRQVCNLCMYISRHVSQCTHACTSWQQSCPRWSWFSCNINKMYCTKRFGPSSQNQNFTSTCLIGFKAGNTGNMLARTRSTCKCHRRLWETLFSTHHSAGSVGYVTNAHLLPNALMRNPLYPLPLWSWDAATIMLLY